MKTTTPQSLLFQKKRVLHLTKRTNTTADAQKSGTTITTIITR